MTTVHTSDERDLRLDLFRGLANWAIFLDHIPNNVAAWITARNYGFSDAADLFVFVSGYTVAFVYARVLRVQGVASAAFGILGRAWQIYVAHVMVFVFYVVAVGYIAQRFQHAHLLDEFNIRRLIAEPVEFLKHGLLLEFKPLNLDVLPLYVVLMAVFPLVLLLLIRKPDVTLFASFAIYLGVWIFGWNLPAYPQGVWYFNPFAWQFLFVIGAWMAVGRNEHLQILSRSPITLSLAFAVLLLACAVTLVDRLEVTDRIPAVLAGVFSLNDKTNLSPYRLIHFLALALVVTWLVPRASPMLRHPCLHPVIICGQRSLEVFCAGLFLSFVAYLLIEIVSGSAWFHVAVSTAGILAMVGVARLATLAKDYPSSAHRKSISQVGG